MKSKISDRIIKQIFIWGLFWTVIPFLLISGWDNPKEFLVRYSISFLGIAFLIYFNIRYLLPFLFFKKQQVLYLILVVSLAVFIPVIMHMKGLPWSHWFSNVGAKNPAEFGGFQSNLGLRWIGRTMPFLTSLAGSSIFEVFYFFNQKADENLKLQREKHETELKFLRSQMNPHFLFNAINNVDTLIPIHPVKASDNLLILSDMLRYMLYDCSSGDVYIKQEIEYIKNYISLFQLKDSQGMNIRVNIEENTSTQRIAPMILTPIIENAFKHSDIEDMTKGWISINLSTQESELKLIVQNSVSADNFTNGRVRDKVGGIGLTNVKRRLSLLYPERHALKIQNDINEFSVELQITLV